MPKLNLIEGTVYFIEVTPSLGLSGETRLVPVVVKELNKTTAYAIAKEDENRNEYNKRGAYRINLRTGEVTRHYVYAKHTFWETEGEYYESKKQNQELQNAKSQLLDLIPTLTLEEINEILKKYKN